VERLLATAANCMLELCITQLSLGGADFAHGMIFVHGPSPFEPHRCAHNLIIP
jgi:hypothetical protein